MANLKQQTRQWIQDVLQTDDPAGVSIHPISQGWGRLQRGRSVNCEPLNIHGWPFTWGLGSHADSYSPDEHTGDWAKHVGNWNVNPAAHPKGLRPLSDAIHQAGMKFLLWFEPERAIWGTPLTREHPEWFLGPHQDGANCSSGGRRIDLEMISRSIALWRTDTNEGVVVAFRREKCPYSAGSVPLNDLDPAAQYELEDADSGERRIESGETLRKNGLPLTMEMPRSSRLVFYKKHGE